MLEAVLGRGDSLLIVAVVERADVDTVRGIIGTFVAGHAAVDDATTGDAGHIRDTRERGAVNAEGCVGREWKRAATAALEVGEGVDALPGACRAAKDTAGHVSLAARVARARARPPLLTLIDRAGRAGFGAAYTVANRGRSGADAGSGVFRGRGGEAIAAREAAGVGANA